MNWSWGQVLAAISVFLTKPFQIPYVTSYSKYLRENYYNNSPPFPTQSSPIKDFEQRVYELLLYLHYHEMVNGLNPGVSVIGLS